MADGELLCMECLGPATIQFIDAHGYPVGTLCAECNASYQEMHAKMMKLLDTAATQNRQEG